MLCEGTGSNVFCVFDGVVVTPPLSSGCLAGITRELVIEWYDVHERDISMTELADADEVFLTSTTRDVQAVKRLNGKSRGKKQPVTKAVAEEWVRRAAARHRPLAVSTAGLRRRLRREQSVEQPAESAGHRPVDERLDRAPGPAQPGLLVPANLASRTRSG